jgi:hypothetical protein
VFTTYNCPPLKSCPNTEGDLEVDDDGGPPFVDVTMELFEDGVLLPYAGRVLAV